MTLGRRWHPPLSEHAALEVSALFHRGAPLDPGEPVPGCVCVTCQVYAAGGRRAEDIEEAEDAIAILAGLPVDVRLNEAERWAEKRDRCGRDVRLPPPGVLTLLAGGVPGAVRWSTPDVDVDGLPRISPDRHEWERMVGMARAVSRRGCGAPTRMRGAREARAGVGGALPPPR